MEEQKAITMAERNAACVSYKVDGQEIQLDINFARKYLVHGRAEFVSDQDLMFFINTCKMRGLNPLVAGEVYLICYAKGTPAQMVIGKDAFLRRAYSDPNFLSKEDGITVQRGDQIIQKEGCCLYPGEKLVGGWCRVTYLRGGKERTAFREVSLAEYSSGMANWKTKPSTMINKVAISQCIRDAFPKDYEGLYSEEEMVASGAVPPLHTINTTAREVAAGKERVVAQEEPVITNEQRQEMFRIAKKALGDSANSVIKDIIAKLGYESTSGMTLSTYSEAMAELQAVIEKDDEAKAWSVEESPEVTKAEE